MTKRLEEAIKAISQLPEADQDTIATLVIEKISEKGAITPFPVDSTNIESLDKFYTYRERTGTLQFLTQHPFLVPVLLEAPAKIRHYFPDEELYLEVHSDPEIANYVQLFLDIMSENDTDETLEEAFDKEEQLSKDWYLSLPDEVREVFCFGVQ